MRIKVFPSNKGGVGKSTTAASLTAYFKDKKKDVRKGKKEPYKILLIDADPQGNVTSNFLTREDYKKKFYTLRDIFKKYIEREDAFKNFGLEYGRHIEEGLNIDDINLDQFDSSIEFDLQPYIIKKTENFHIIPANSDLELVNRDINGRNKSDFYLKTILSWISNEYDLCIIDTPPNLSALTTNCIIAADDIYIPLKLGGYELSGLVTLLTAIGDVDGLEKIRGVFITQYEKKLAINDDVEDGIVAITNLFEKKYKNLKIEFMKTKINKNTSLNEANTIKTNIYDFKPNSSGAKDYAKLAEEIIKMDKEQEQLRKAKELDELEELKAKEKEIRERIMEKEKIKA